MKQLLAAFVALFVSLSNSKAIQNDTILLIISSTKYSPNSTKLPGNTTSHSNLPPSDTNCIHPNPPIQNAKCLGFERDCVFDMSYSSSLIRCSERSADQSLQSVADQINRFWYQADFGYLKRKLNRFASINQCLVEKEHLRCSDDETFCSGRNVILAKSNKLKFGLMLAKHCVKPATTGENRGFFMSWTDALVYTDSDNSTSVCDTNRLNKTVLLVKIDPAVNLYHHVTNFFNLYITELMSNYLDLGKFDYLVLWTRFGDAFDPPKAYKQLWLSYAHTIFWSQIQLFKEYGSRVCVKEVILAHPPRARRGIYFRMPLVFGCENSGLMHLFRTDILHRLNVVEMQPRVDRIRVSLIQRPRSSHRHVVNMEQIQGVLTTFKGIQLELIDGYTEKTSLATQIDTFANTDVLIGMHGAGLTHLLWLPVWASVIEIWHCGDEAVFYDLARLRGVDYRVGEYEDMVRPENTTEWRPKFTNYWVDVEQLMSLVLQSVRHVVQHPVFIDNAITR